jgi:hypothetical protein
MSALTMKYALALCNKLGISKEHWGTLNNALCDAYFEGQKSMQPKSELESPVLDGDLSKPFKFSSENL